MKTKRLLLALTALALFAGMMPAEARDRHHRHDNKWRQSEWRHDRHHDRRTVVYRDYRPNRYHRPAAPVISIPVPPVVVVRP